MSVAVFKWYRAIDSIGRFYTFAMRGDEVTIYFPEIYDTELHVGRHGVRDPGTGIDVAFWREKIKRPELEAWLREYACSALFPSSAVPGECYPRMYRGPETPPPPAKEHGPWTASVRVARSLYVRLSDIFDVIEPIRKHRRVFGHELRQLLILACTEVESSWRAILKASKYPGDPKRWRTTDYVKLLEPMRLDSYSVGLAAHEEYGEIWPFEGWGAANPTGSLAWYDAYNATKHDREDELKRATLGDVITALAAVHVLVAAQFGFSEQGHGRFHADAFNFRKRPTWTAEAYIRPLASPDDPDHLTAWQKAGRWRPVPHPALK